MGLGVHSVLQSLLSVLRMAVRASEDEPLPLTDLEPRMQSTHAKAAQTLNYTKDKIIDATRALSPKIRCLRESATGKPQGSERTLWQSLLQ